MSSITITMLGLSGTGKTHACKSLFRMMERENSEHQIFLTADGDTYQEKSENTRLIRDYAPETRDRFTRSGTEGVWELPLALCVNYKKGLPNYPILKIPVLDYAGGIVKTVARGIQDDEDHEAKQNAKKLLDSILEADVLMLLADANILSENPRPDASLDQIKDYIGRDINDIFLNLVELYDSSFINRQRTVILMLTKCDSNLIDPSLSADAYCGLMARAATVFKSILKVCRQYDWPFAVVPTSACGNGNSHTTREDFGRYTSMLDPSVEMKPYGFDLAFLYGLMSELHYRVGHKIDNSATVTHTESLNKKQRGIVEQLSRQEANEKWKLYRELEQFLHGHLDELLHARGGMYILEERSAPFFKQELAEAKGNSLLDKIMDIFSL